MVVILVTKSRIAVIKPDTPSMILASDYSTHQQAHDNDTHVADFIVFEGAQNIFSSFISKYAHVSI